MIHPSCHLPQTHHTAPEVLMRSPYDQQVSFARCISRVLILRTVMLSLFHSHILFSLHPFCCPLAIQSDMWSCGVIMFLLLGGDLPFVGRSQKELFRNIVMGKYEFQEESWSHVSEQAKDLVKQLLVTDPSQRLSSCEAMASPWMRQRGGLLAKNNLQYTSQRLKGFNARQKLRASMICVSSVVSLRLSMRSLKSERSVLKASESKPPSESERPSFLDLPVEGMSEEEDED